jgi:hypothetical protein
MSIMEDLPHWTGKRSDGLTFCAECGAPIGKGLPQVDTRLQYYGTPVSWHWACYARAYGRTWEKLYQRNQDHEFTDKPLL